MPPQQFRTLAYAAKLVGGEDELARRLGVTRAELEQWLSAGVRPPLGIFLKVVDIVHDAALGQLLERR